MRTTCCCGGPGAEVAERRGRRCGASAVIPADGGAPPWRVVDTLPDTATYTYDLFAVTAPGPQNASAFGRASYKSGKGLQFSPMLRHWNGRSWRRVLLPGSVAARWNASVPLQAGSSSARNVRVFPLGAWVRCVCHS